MKQDKMTGKELIEKIIEGIPEKTYSGSPEDVEIKLALYVYTQLGKMKSIDEKIYWANGRISYKLIDEAKKDSKNINRLARKRKLICISMANLYSQILNRLGIMCEVRRGDAPDIHLDNLITLKSGRMIFADLQLDLYNVRTGRKLECFKAIGKEDFLEDEILNHYLMDIGYVFDGESYRNNRVEEIRERIEFLSPKDALATILGSDEVYRGIEGLDVSEAYLYYRETIASLLGNEKSKKVYRFPCYVMDRNKEPNYSTFCIFADTGNYRTLVPYLYSQKYGRMLVCDLDKLENMRNKGLHFGGSRFYTGRKKLEEYMRRLRISKELREEKGSER